MNISGGGEETGERKWGRGNGGAGRREEECMFVPTGVYLTCVFSSSGDTYMAVPTRPVSPAQFTCSG